MMMMMKCFEIFLILSMCVMVYGQDPLELEAICKNNTIGTNKFFGVPSNCTLWVACSGLTVVNNGACPNQRHFNGALEQCDFIGCHQTIPDWECLKTTYPKQFLPHSFNCTMYYSCQFGVIKLETCDTGNFDGLNACKTTAPCVTSGCVGKGLVDPEIVPNPDDCQKGYVCFEGEAMVDAEIKCRTDEFLDNLDFECMNCFEAHCTLTGPSLKGDVARSQCSITALP